MSINVFLADDHTVLRDGLQLLLENQPDIKVIGSAGNGRAAVQLVKETQPDVVILDIIMPKMNGIDAACEIISKCPHTQVIVLSMFSNPEHVFRALDAGARGYLLKESAGIEVVQAVYAVHAGRRYLSDHISEVVIDDYIHWRTATMKDDPVMNLSAREWEILQLIAEGKSRTEIAEKLSLSPRTIDTYRSRVMKKLDLSDSLELIKFAVRHGLISLY